MKIVKAGKLDPQYSGALSYFHNVMVLLKVDLPLGEHMLLHRPKVMREFWHRPYSQAPAHLR
jgi:hypothetical protein